MKGIRKMKGNELTTLTNYIIKASNGEKISRDEFCDAMTCLLTLNRVATNKTLTEKERNHLIRLIESDIELDEMMIDGLSNDEFVNGVQKGINANKRILAKIKEN